MGVTQFLPPAFLQKRPDLDVRRRLGQRGIEALARRLSIT